MYKNLLNLNVFPLGLAVILAAVLVFGFLLSVWAKGATVMFFTHIRFDEALERTGWKHFMEKARAGLNFIDLFSYLVQFFILVLILMLGAEIVGLTLFFGLLEKMVLYYPNIFISMLIFTISVYLIDFSQKIVVGTKTLNKITYSRLFGRILDYSIRFLTFLAICYQLAIVPQLILIVFIGVVATITLSLGISIGLAAKDPMAQFIQDLKKSFFE